MSSLSKQPMPAEEVMPRMTERHTSAINLTKAMADENASERGVGQAELARFAGIISEIQQVIRELASPASQYVLVPRKEIESAAQTVTEYGEGEVRYVINRFNRWLSTPSTTEEEGCRN